jgi:hypothetical protein
MVQGHAIQRHGIETGVGSAQSAKDATDCPALIERDSLNKDQSIIATHFGMFFLSHSNSI